MRVGDVLGLQIQQQVADLVQLFDSIGHGGDLHVMGDHDHLCSRVFGAQQQRLDLGTLARPLRLRGQAGHAHPQETKGPERQHDDGRRAVGRR